MSWQKEKNLIRLKGENIMEDKLYVLQYIGDLFNNHNIRWVLGASCMLYLRGITNHFDDIDIIISNDDVDEVKRLLSIHDLNEISPNEMYQTRTFLEYKINKVDLDIMAGFTIVANKKTHYFPLEEDNKRDQYFLNGTIIFLDSIEAWLKYYTLMNRLDKVQMIKEAKLFM